MQETDSTVPLLTNATDADLTVSEKVYTRDFDAQNEDSLAKLARLIPARSRVLDVGCGNADLGEYLRREKQCHVIGLDQSETTLAIAKKKLDEVLEVDLDDNLISDVVNENFDVIVFADILEHIMTPERILMDAKSILRKNGKILISIPNAGYIGALLSLYEGEWEYRDEGILDTTHVRFYTGKSLQKLVRRAGLYARIADRVTKDLTASEFTQRLDTLPNTVRDWLCAKPEAATYQFIAEVTSEPQKSLADESCTSPQLTLQHLTKLYVRAQNEVFDETNTHFAHGEMGHTNLLRFKIGEGEIAAMQFAFADRAGIYELYKIEVYDGETLKCELSSLDEVFFEQASTFSEGYLLPIRLVAFSENASVGFTLPYAITGKTLSVHIHLHAPVSPNNLTFIPQVSEALYRDGLQQHQALLTQVERQFAKIESIAKLYQEAVDYQQTLETRIDTLNSDKKSLESNLTQMLNEIKQQRDNLQSQLDAMMASSSWKITAPLRWLNAKISRRES